MVDLSIVFCYFTRGYTWLLWGCFSEFSSPKGSDLKVLRQLAPCKSHLNGSPKVATMRCWWCLSFSALSIFLLKFLSKSFKIVPFFWSLAPRYPVLEQVLDLMSDRTPCFTNVKSDFGKICQVKVQNICQIKCQNICQLAGIMNEVKDCWDWKQWEYSSSSYNIYIWCIWNITNNMKFVFLEIADLSPKK